MKAKTTHDKKKITSEEKLQIHLKKQKELQEEYLKNLSVLKLNDSIKKPSNILESKISVKRISEEEVIEAVKTADPDRLCYTGLLDLCELCQKRLDLFNKDLGGSILSYNLVCRYCHLLYSELFYQRD